MDDDEQWIDVYVTLEVEIDGDLINIERRPGHDSVNLNDNQEGRDRSLCRSDGSDNGEISLIYSTKSLPSSGNVVRYIKSDGDWVPKKRDFLGRGSLPRTHHFNNGTLEHKACEALQQAEMLFPELTDALKRTYESYKK